MSLSVYGVVLAAGGSSRLGRAKQLVISNGKPLVVGIVEKLQLAGVERVVVVVGSSEDAVCTALAGLPVDLVRNGGWVEGMGGSIAAGVRHAASAGAGAVLIALTDQPGIGLEHYRDLLDGYRESNSLLATGYPEGAGVPAIFPRSYFGELERLSGDGGGRALLLRHSDRLTIVPNAAAVRDVDIPADL